MRYFLDGGVSVKDVHDWTDQWDEAFLNVYELGKDFESWKNFS